MVAAISTTTGAASVYHDSVASVYNGSVTPSLFDSVMSRSVSRSATHDSYDESDYDGDNITTNRNDDYQDSVKSTAGVKTPASAAHQEEGDTKSENTDTTEDSSDEGGRAESGGSANGGRGIRDEKTEKEEDECNYDYGDENELDTEEEHEEDEEEDYEDESTTTNEGLGVEIDTLEKNDDNSHAGGASLSIYPGCGPMGGVSLSKKNGNSNNDINDVDEDETLVVEKKPKTFKLHNAVVEMDTFGEAADVLYVKNYKGKIKFKDTVKIVVKVEVSEAQDNDERASGRCHPFVTRGVTNIYIQYKTLACFSSVDG